MSEGTFGSTSSENLDGMVRSLTEGAISRADYRRLCRWLMGLRSVMGMPRDTTLEIMESLEGGVNRAQRMLLEVALKKCQGAIEQCTVETDFINEWVRSQGLQLGLF